MVATGQQPEWVDEASPMQRELSARGGRSTSGIGPCCRGRHRPPARRVGRGAISEKHAWPSAVRQREVMPAVREKSARRATGSLMPGERKARMCLQLRFAVGRLLQTGAEGGCCVKNARPDGMGVPPSRGRQPDSSAVFTRKRLAPGAHGRLCARRI